MYSPEHPLYKSIWFANMSGLEVLGGISAVIAIIDGSVKVWESARKDLKFSETFETVGNRLPILRDTLQTCYEHFEPINISLPADAAQGLVKTIDNCKKRAEKLGAIF
jgi:N-terminal domain on NACHT_NTPase and P-loop NTPases